MKLKTVAAMLTGTAMVVASPAWAQAAPATDPATANAQAVDDAQAKIAKLQAEIEALQSSVEQVKASMVKATPSWAGAPKWEDKAAGFSFKPKGLIQWDAGYNGYPRGNEIRSNGTTTPLVNTGGLNYQNLGWNSRARRLTIGADGTIPGGFRYSAEFNFAQGSVDYEDIYMAYDFHNSPATLQVGYFYPFSSLETMTSSKFTSFMERAGITDAFNYNRRLGIAFLANDKKNDHWVVQGGIFNEPLNNGNFNRTGWQASLRGVYAPNVGNGRLHIGANFQYRQNTETSFGQNYQARPLNQVTDQRYISTGTIASKGDLVLGLEFAGLFKSFHFASEAQKVWLHGTYNAADYTRQNGQLDTNETATGATYNGDPSFWGGYAEVGYYLTGETRGYKGGAWQRTKVLHPFSQGGWGAFQVNGRVDYLDLTDAVGGVITPNPGSGYGLGSNSTFVNGGKQLGAEFSMIWNPTDYVRFMAQYAHIHVVGGPRATVSTAGNPLVVPPIPPQLGLFPVGTTTDPSDRKYNSNVFTMRAQVDF